MVQAVTFSYRRVGLFIFPSDVCGMTVWEHRATHGCDCVATRVPPQLLRVPGRESTGPHGAPQVRTGSGGQGALCDPLLCLFLRNYLGLALKRASTS